MQKPLKAALYIRVSTEEQAEEGQSVPAQLETLKQYCSAFGIEVYDIYTDLGLSGKRLKDRMELARLMEDCIGRRFNLVLVWKISRLSRNLKDLLYLIDLFERNDVNFTSCSEKFDTSTPVGRMTLQLLGSIAEFERNTIVENVKLGLGEFARKGGKASTVLGYDNVSKRLVINEEEAGIVRLIFSLYTEAGMNFSAIARYLNELGCRTKRGSEFRGSGISYIIQNPVYIGVNRHRINKENSYLVKAMHPPIIDSILWSKTQETISGQSKSGTINMRSSDTSLFEVTCMMCKMPMKIFYTFSRGKKYIYYRCYNCSNYVNVENLKKAISDTVIKAMENYSLQNFVNRLLFKRNSSNELSNIEITAIDSEINRLKKSKARYLSLFEGYKLTDSKTFIDRISEIEELLNALENKKLEIGKSSLDFYSTELNEENIDKLKDGLSALEPEVIKQAAACLVKSIEACKNDITVVLYL